MLDISMGELTVLLVLALILIGPEKLPQAARTLAKVMVQVRRMSAEFRLSMDEAMREEEPPPYAKPPAEEKEEELEKKELPPTDPILGYDPGEIEGGEPEDDAAAQAGEGPKSEEQAGESDGEVRVLHDKPEDPEPETEENKEKDEGGS